MSFEISTITLHGYNGDIDKEDVTEMCKNVYGGTDRVPRSLDGFEKSKTCFPLVIRSATNTIAFCNVRLFHNDDETEDVIYIEAIRVSEDHRNKGIGRYLLQHAMKEILTWQRAAKTIRFLSTTIPSNEPMIKIFEKAGWMRMDDVEIWPSYTIFHDILKVMEEKSQSYLETSGISSLTPTSAFDKVSEWKQLTNRVDITRYLNIVRDYGACGFRTMYYIIDTNESASCFLDEPYDKNEKREVWVLERNNKPPVVIFIQLQSLNSSLFLPPNMISAFVVDVEGAECCIAFAATRKYLPTFRIVLDPKISKSVMQKSALLSMFETSTYSIYEAQG